MRYRAFVVPAAGLALVLAGFLAFSLNESLVYFQTPGELLDQGSSSDDRLRLGGQVVGGTVVAGAEAVTFEVTDGTDAVTVVHRGAPPQLFQEGIGVVVEGRWTDGVFRSDTMLVRHDEQYRTRDGERYETPQGEAAR